MDKQKHLSIWEKIINILKKLFNKNKALLIEEPRKENINFRSNNIVEELSKENRIIMLQQKYKNGSVKLNEISDEDKNELISLYKKQIENLKYNISMKKNELNGYKDQILYAKENIKINNN